MPTLFRQTKPHALPAGAEIVGKDGKPHARIRDGKQTKLFPLTADGKRKPVRLIHDPADGVRFLAVRSRSVRMRSRTVW